MGTQGKVHKSWTWVVYCIRSICTILGIPTQIVLLFLVHEGKSSQCAADRTRMPMVIGLTSIPFGILEQQTPTVRFVYQVKEKLTIGLIIFL
ncbi:hypothetical protein SDC9_108625 [bioreactor metagenome]|uniref:Uncharacterized protein n=1 Tax=bioreactor metagenome TaxID=1076179 RepID=A0A645B8M0_9ZZZZ